MVEQATVVREIQWTDEITTALTHPAAGACLPWLEREVRAGLSQLWECTNGAQRLYVVTRLDENPREWVLCYARGSGLRTFAPHFIRVASAKGWPLRAHTLSPALVRVAQRLGFGEPEYILRR